MRLFACFNSFKLTLTQSSNCNRFGIIPSFETDLEGNDTIRFVFVFNRGDTRYHGGLRSRELCQAPMVKVQALSSHSHHSLV